MDYMSWLTGLVPWKFSIPFYMKPNIYLPVEFGPLDVSPRRGAPFQERTRSRSAVLRAQGDGCTICRAWRRMVLVFRLPGTERCAENLESETMRERLFY